MTSTTTTTSAATNTSAATTTIPNRQSDRSAPHAVAGPADRHNDRVAGEHDLLDLHIAGRVPDALSGTLFRNGPKPRFPADQHLFASDGMVHAFRIDSGRVRWQNRWVRTARWCAEHEAGRALKGRSLAPAGSAGETASAEDIAPEGVANTNVIQHAGRLLALEELHLPFEIDARTLHTIGPVDMNGALHGPFTAHPKLDPADGSLHWISYCADGPMGCAIGTGSIDSSGRVRRGASIDAPYSSMVHDFGITGAHVLLPVLPLSGSLERAQSGRPPYAWEPRRGARVGVLPRAAASASDLRWIEIDPCYVFHWMNAWTVEGSDGRVIEADVMRYEEPPLFPHADGRPTDPEKAKARLVRWRFDLGASGTNGRADFTMQPLLDDAGEFPRIDDRWAGRRNRHGWFATDEAGLAHVDLDSGITRRWRAEEGERVGEPVFVPRHSGAAEGDGWLLVVVQGATRSSLAIFDAQAVDAGPLARAWIPEAIGSGFHGNWVGHGS